MRTQFRTKEEYALKFLEIAESTKAVNNIRPVRFMEVMKKNQGAIQKLTCYGNTEDGLERKNPVIVALGDSVTAGHFEFAGDPFPFFQKADAGLLGEDDVIEITDARECYLEKFRGMLIDKYERTSVSTINSGIAGDTILGMEKRVYRDVVRYQPDLVLINASLNWGPECGPTDVYEAALRRVIALILKETKADLILMTPNMEISLGVMVNTQSCLDERVEVIRKLAEEYHVGLADTYKVWKAYEAAGYPVQELLANGSNHPSTVGHEVYAKVLMQLIGE